MVILRCCRAPFGSTYSNQRGRGLGAGGAKLVLTVLSWNIFGSSQKGMASVRNILVPAVIQSLSPDIALLQETRTNLAARRIIEATWRQRHYKDVCSKKKTESRILYDVNLYAPIPLNDHLDRAIDRLEPEKRVSQVLTKHTSIMGLRQATVSGECSLPTPVVFLSFHNTRSREVASAFCQVVKTLERDLETLVVAGVDMNCRLGTFDTHGTHIPTFTSSKRRPNYPIDFFVLSSRSSRAKEEIRCEGLVDAYHNKSSKLNKTVREAAKVMEMEDETFTSDKISVALNHDPLVCELTLTEKL
jgi:hypothetical protein